MENNIIGILDPEGINNNPFNNKSYSDEYKELAKIWSQFPAYKQIKNIIKSFSENQVILITSGTGSGKTVIIPKAILHLFNYEKKIVVTLPKQIIAKSAAEFAAKTLDVNIGNEVGYIYKGSEKNAVSENTKLLYATDGTIVAKLMKDPELREFSAVVIDEAHERKVQIDFLLYLLKQTCKMRDDFKLIIMSATVNEQIFKNYFYDFKFIHFDVGSMTNYPIESIFLKESINKNNYIDKGLEIIKEILESTQDGDILFFVNSIQETFDTCKKINELNGKLYCVEVYAGMNQINQELAQHETMYKDKFGKNRKIIISTNVAESSLTISNIKYVIDSGYELFNYYDPDKRSKVLEKKLITQAQSKQRMGRAGRTGAGICYHLYTKNDFDNIMEKYPQPAIKISNIYDECLKLLNLPNVGTVDNLTEILNQFIEPPSDKYIKSALLQLMQLGLIKSGKITQIGAIVANLQVDPMEGLSIYIGYNLNCVKEVIAIISMINAIKNNIAELFIEPLNIIEKNKTKFLIAKKSLMSKYGDHITLLKIFNKFIILKKQDDKKLHNWLYISFLKKDVLYKAFTYFKKLRGISMQRLTDIDKIQISNLMEYEIYDRIMCAFMYGYRLNISFYKEKNKSYDTDKVRNVQISKESWMHFYDNPKKKIIYNELFIMNNKNDLKIVSTLEFNSKLNSKVLRIL